VRVEAEALPLAALVAEHGVTAHLVVPPLAGEDTLATGLRVIPTPGHTPGHQPVLLETSADTVLLTGDLLVNSIQLVEPELAYSSEMDADAARADLLRNLTARGNTTLAPPSRRAVRFPRPPPLSGGKGAVTGRSALLRPAPPE
jgi:glyoxylase-like metal-dependent hydrolase (beta-lactamase superfamily II)